MSILNTSSRRLAVVGDPIDHSKSPQLHTVAYAELGLDWKYERLRVTDGELSAVVAGFDQSWRGISVTMPLKGEAFAVATDHDAASALSKASNTLLFDGPRIRAFNTDVAGLVNPFRRLYGEANISSADSAVIVGAGATAASAVIALVQLGIPRVTLVARSRERAAAVIDLCQRLNIDASFVDLQGLSSVGHSALTVSTVPGSAGLRLDLPVEEGDVLFDIAYDVWPSANAQRWSDNGGFAISGLTMLAAQALEQVRIFVTGSDTGALPSEDEVRVAMNASVGLDESGLYSLSVG